MKSHGSILIRIQLIFLTNEIAYSPVVISTNKIIFPLNNFIIHYAIFSPLSFNFYRTIFAFDCLINSEHILSKFINNIIVVSSSHAIINNFSKIPDEWSFFLLIIRLILVIFLKINLSLFSLFAYITFITDTSVMVLFHYIVMCNQHYSGKTLRFTGNTANYIFLMHVDWL